MKSGCIDFYRFIKRCRRGAEVQRKKIDLKTLSLCVSAANIFLFISAVLLSGCIPSRNQNLQKNQIKTFTILYTGSAMGEIKPCGCSKEGDMGGLSRRATYITDLRKSNKNIVLLDTGDNFLQASEQGVLKAQTMLKGMEFIGYDGMTFGEKDFIYGIKYLSDNSLGLWTAANFNIPKNKFVKSYIIKTLPNGLKVAIIGLLDPVLFDDVSKHSNAEFSDPVSVLRAILKELKNETVDLTILLTHSKVDLAKELLNIQGVNVVINGHIEDLAAEDEVFSISNKLLVHPKERGQQIGRIDVEINNKKIMLTNNYTPLISKFKDHPMLASLYDGYNKKVEDLFFESLKKKGKKYKVKGYISNLECKKCHAAEHDKWETTRHSAAFKSLENIDKQHDPECILCHTVGFGKEGGFIEETITGNLKNVQCENCHGPGEVHSKNSNESYNSNAKEVCGQCHNKIHSPAFEFSKYWEKISH